MSDSLWLSWQAVRPKLNSHGRYREPFIVFIVRKKGSGSIYRQIDSEHVISPVPTHKCLGYYPSIDIKIEVWLPSNGRLHQTSVTKEQFDNKVTKIHNSGSYIKLQLRRVILVMLSIFLVPNLRNVSQVCCHLYGKNMRNMCRHFEVSIFLCSGSTL